jgi:hypothetical protein
VVVDHHFFKSILVRAQQELKVFAFDAAFPCWSSGDSFPGQESFAIQFRQLYLTVCLRRRRQDFLPRFN